MTQLTKNPARISGYLKGAALGATLAMLPMAIYSLLYALKVIEGEPQDDPIKPLAIIQFVGCMIWAGFLISCFLNASRFKISKFGIVLCIGGIILCGMLQLLFTFNYEFRLRVGWFIFLNDDTKAIILISIVALISNLPIVLGTNMLRRRLPVFNIAKIGFLMLALFPIFYIYLSKIIISVSHYDYDYGYYYKLEYQMSTLFTIASILLFLSVLISIIGWWGASCRAQEIENGTVSLTPQASYVEQSAPASVQYSEHIAPSSITDEQKKTLMGMSNNELTNIINTPSLYANPAFVEEARKTLIKRQGWEVIKDYTDEQLLNLVHDNVQGFSAEVLDAASMELLSRENATFINEVSSLSVPELQDMLSKADSYYDGYIQLATRVLNERINLSRKA